MDEIQELRIKAEERNKLLRFIREYVSRYSLETEALVLYCDDLDEVFQKLSDDDLVELLDSLATGMVIASNIQGIVQLAMKENDNG